VKKALSRNSILFAISVFSLGIIFISLESYTHDAFGLEENFVTLQTGIISTQDRDFAISNDFETRIFQNGKIMRLSGVTTTGEPYYIYQKNIDNEIILKGKILLEGTFVSIVQKEIISEPQVSLESGTKLLMFTKIPHNTYAGYTFTIGVKVFDLEQNPKADFYDKDGVLEDVFVNVRITNEFGKIATTFNGTTDVTGLFLKDYRVKYGLDLPGKYTVNVFIDDGTSSTSQSYTTFFRGDIRDYLENVP
jgi:hypothetical protein